MLHEFERIYIDLTFCWSCICGASTSGYHFGYFLQQTFQSCQGRWTFKNKEPPFLNVKFANKGIGALNLSNMLNQQSVQSKIPPYFQFKESPSISYSYTRSVASKIFKHFKASLQQIDFDGLSQNPTPCSCCDSEFLNAPCGHIVTGDLSIFRNQNLKDVLRKGPKYREPVSYSWHQNFNIIMDACEEYARRWTKKEDVKSTLFPSGFSRSPMFWNVEFDDLNALSTPDTSPFSVTLRLSENFPVSMRTLS